MAADGRCQLRSKWIWPEVPYRPGRSQDGEQVSQPVPWLMSPSCGFHLHPLPSLGEAEVAQGAHTLHEMCPPGRSQT